MSNTMRNRRLAERCATLDALRGRPLSAREQLNNLTAALSEHDSDCASHRGAPCDCGADDFARKFSEQP